MPKRRQPDFPKTQLRPGRPLTRGRNVTNTSFKAKKICMQRKGHRSQKSQFTIQDCLKSVSSGVTSARITALNHLNSIIINNTDSFFISIAEVLEAIAVLILENDDNLRNTATDVIINILEFTDDLKIASFIPLLLNSLSCAMVHTLMRIKENSLKLLNCLLETHPNLICNSTSILKNLLKMIAELPRKSHSRAHSQSTRQRSSLVVNYSDCIYSQNWRIHVLGHMNLFLKEMLKDAEKCAIVEDDRDEQEVYWNCESTFNLVIYAAGGLKPVDVEKSFSNTMISQELYFDDPQIIDEFIIPVIKIIPKILVEELAGECKSDETLLHRDTIQNLSILLQVLNRLAEWAKLLSCDDVDRYIVKFLWNYICKPRRFPFIIKGSVFDVKAPNLPCVQLNLVVCFLYSRYLLQLNDDKDTYDRDTFMPSIFSYIKSVCNLPIKVKCDSIPMLVKIMKIYYSKTEIPAISDFIKDTLFHMSSLIKVIDDCLNKNMLTSLFVKLSLDSAYYFLSETGAMKNWFKWLLDQLAEIPKSDMIDKKLLKVTKKIANCRYPCFLQILDGIDHSVIKALLKYDNEDVTDTVIFLIYYMKDISESLLEDITNIILLDSSFPTRFAIRLIRLLTCRFTEKPQGTDTEREIFKRGRVDFIQFLLNIAIDSLNLSSEKWADYEANEYTNAMKPFKDVTAYNIFPSLQWKEHSVLFEVCQKSLNLLPKKIVNRVAILMFKEILDHIRNLPIHCAIAILKLNNCEMNERCYLFHLHDLIFSSLLTTSVLTHMSIEDEWYRWNVMELMKSIELSREAALETIRQLEYDKNGEIKAIAVYHILRICKFYLEKRLLVREDGKKVLNTLKRLKEKCADQTLNRQPLFIQLYNYFTFYV